MIAYLDPSVIIRAYLPDESDHEEVRALIRAPEATLVSGSWTRIEVTSALVRAARAHRGDEAALLRQFSIDVDPRSGTLTLVDAEQAAVEAIALGIVRRSGIRSLDAWHLACASLAFDQLREPGEECGFATRDRAQQHVALELGFTLV